MANALSMRTIHQIAEPSVLDGNQTRIVMKTGSWQVTYMRVGSRLDSLAPAEFWWQLEAEFQCEDGMEM